MLRDSHSSDCFIERYNLIVIPAPQKICFNDLYVAFEGKFCLSDGCDFADITQSVLSGYLSSISNFHLVFVANEIISEEGYKLTVCENKATIQAATRVGRHYAVLTLLQLIDWREGCLPIVDIEDYPDFPNRGLMVDISRNKVPTLGTLKKIVDLIARLKMNMLQLYVEGRAFYFESKKEYYSDPNDFLTSSDVSEMECYCRERFVRLEPCSNCLGHMAFWLAQPQYKHLAYNSNGLYWANGTRCPASTIEPKSNSSFDFATELFDELIDAYSCAEYLNIGGDEPFEMLYGQTNTADADDVYFEYIGKICKYAQSRNRTPMLWGDVAKRSPEKFNSLGDAVFLEWGYTDGDFKDENCAIYKANNARFYVCPSTGLYSSFTGRTDNMLNNIYQACHFGKKYNAEGFLLTDWGDGGTAQYWVSEFYPYGVGACMAWNVDGYDDAELKKWLDKNVYNIQLADLVADMGRYQQYQHEDPMTSKLFTGLYLNQLFGINVDNNFSDPCLYFGNRQTLDASEVTQIKNYVTSLYERLPQETNNVYVDEAKACIELLNLAATHAMTYILLRNNDCDKQAVTEMINLLEHYIDTRERLWKEFNKPSDYNLSIYRFVNLLNQYRFILANWDNVK